MFPFCFIYFTNFFISFYFHLVLLVWTHPAHLSLLTILLNLFNSLFFITQYSNDKLTLIRLTTNTSVARVVVFIFIPVKMHLLLEFNDVNCFPDGLKFCFTVHQTLYICQLWKETRGRVN